MIDLLPQFKFIISELKDILVLDDMPGPVALVWKDGKQIPIEARSFKFEDASFNVECFREFMQTNQFTIVSPYKAYQMQLENGEMRIVVRGYFA